MVKRLLLLLLFPITVLAQFTPWNTFIDTSRAIDWTSAGFTIVEPTVACATQPSLLAGSANAAANGTSIANSIASCDTTHNIVNIPAGTWYYTTILLQKSNVLIKGAGPNNTTIIPTVGSGCAGGITAGICFMDPNNSSNGQGVVLPPSGTHQCSNWSGAGGVAGTYTQGATSISVSGCGGTAPPNGELIVLDQNNDSSDTSGVYVCDSFVAGCAPFEAPGNHNGRIITTNTTRSMQQFTTVTNVVNNGGGNFTLTISPGLYFTNIRTSQTPSIWWVDTITNSGVENLSIDGTTMSSGTPTNHGNIGFYQCVKCWVKGIRSMNAGRNHVSMFLSANDVVRDSYFFGALGGGSQSYAVEFAETSANLVENNIFQQVTNPIMTGLGTGNVVDYNFSIFSFYTAGSGQFPQGSYWSHNAGNMMNLYEGNNLIFGPWGDDEWGSSAQTTVFRSMAPGFQTNKTESTLPLQIRAKVRAVNYVGNVLGTTGYHVHYETYATSGSGGIGGATEATSIYSLGWASQDGTCSGSQASNVCDPLSRSTLVRWGNYDTFNAAVQWNSTEAAPAAVPFVNANFTVSYFNSLAHTLPNSLYYAAKPSWWLNGVAWPPIGPDITTGNIGRCTSGTFLNSQALNVGQCSGGTFTASDWGAHVNAIPAQLCYLNTMVGPPDGSGSVLPFDSGTCYAPVGGPFGVTAPGSVLFNSQVVGTSSQPQTFTFTNTGASNLTIGTITLSGSDFSQTNNCPFSGFIMTPGQTCTFNVIFTPTAAGTRNGNITITSNATNTPSIEPLTGTGVVTLTIENGTIIINGTSIQN